LIQTHQFTEKATKLCFL